MSGKNVAASVKQRLLNRSRQTGEDFQLLLTQYAIERLLYRIGESDFAEWFVLKGASVFALWTDEMRRPTRDLDLLGVGERSGESIRETFREICAVEVTDDGLDFDSKSVKIEPIREDQLLGGQRVTLVAKLGTARIDLQVDVGFGDIITPSAEEAEYPTLLDMDPPRIRAYPRETVVAEKLEAMVKLGLTNSRMKDYYDLAIMARSFEFTGMLLRDAIIATFTRRGTAIPDKAPIALTAKFAKDDAKRKQWAAFRKRSGLAETIGELEDVVSELAVFLQPPLMAAATSDEAFSKTWKEGGPWT